MTQNAVRHQAGDEQGDEMAVDVVDDEIKGAEMQSVKIGGLATGGLLGGIGSMLSGDDD